MDFLCPNHREQFAGLPCLHGSQDDFCMHIELTLSAILVSRVLSDRGAYGQFAPGMLFRNLSKLVGIAIRSPGPDIPFQNAALRQGGSMGMPIRQPGAQSARNTGAKSINWRGIAETEWVTITLEADCLRRLLGEHQLYVEDFSCVDESSRTCLRKLLLALISRTGRD